MRAHHLRGCDRNAWILFHAVQPLSREPCQVKECHATHALGHLPTIRIETRATPALLSATENLRVVRKRDSHSRQRAVPGAGIAVVDDRRTCACAIQLPSRLYQSEHAICARIGLQSAQNFLSLENRQLGRTRTNKEEGASGKVHGLHGGLW